MAETGRRSSGRLAIKNKTAQVEAKPVTKPATKPVKAKPAAPSSTKEKAPTPRAKTVSASSKKVLDKANEALEAYKSYQESKRELERLNVDKILSLKKGFKTAVDNYKRGYQALERKKQATQTSRTRSGKRRGPAPRTFSTNGEIINKGMEDVEEKFEPDELEWLDGEVRKVKTVSSLEYPHIKYLICHVLLDELKGIREGRVPSSFHDRYQELKGYSTTELMSEIRTSLFTNDQRDYLNGVLQGAFEACKADANGDVKHNEINYVGIVLLAESAIRIVKFVHQFDTLDETVAFMKRRSREAHGISEDEEDDEGEDHHEDD